MSPAITLDLSADFNPTSQPISTISNNKRTLLLSPPSLSSHPEKLNDVLSSHLRDVTDLQMLDRLALGLVALAVSTYDLVIILADADSTRNESRSLIRRDILRKIVESLRPGGILKSQDGSFAREGEERSEAILAGLVDEGGDGMTKSKYTSTEAIPLRFGKRKKTTDNSTTVTNGNAATALPVSNGYKKAEMLRPASVEFVDFSDDFGEPVIEGEDDDELIDEDTLLDEEDMARPIVIRELDIHPSRYTGPNAYSKLAPECRPKAGKRRRACKDCSCGLAEKLAAEDTAKRTKADAELNTMKLAADDLAEIDFTVKGKVGSCGNCALGDAFRCDGCPYIGLPAFKPGEEVRLLNNDVQL
ncbi:MAG: electron carrier [Cirrosporium novae-zelandiae]|nr:MAG: electron carrier [Cirrosporium novae-zelandiae]